VESGEAIATAGGPEFVARAIEPSLSCAACRKRAATPECLGAAFAHHGMSQQPHSPSEPPCPAPPARHAEEVGGLVEGEWAGTKEEQWEAVEVWWGR